MATTTPAGEIKLKVAEAIQDDVNKGIVRIDSNIIQQIGARPGDLVELQGDRTTLSIVDRAYPGDIGLHIVRMDGITRRNSKTGIGEMVRIRKADVKEASKVIIAPAGKGIIVRAPSGMFKQGLLGRVVVKGDLVSLGGMRTRRSTMSRSPFGDIFNNILDEGMMGGIGFSDIKFIVVDISPKEKGVIITENTEVVFNPEATEVTEDKILEVTYEDVGGLREEISKIREMVELPLKHPEIFQRLGIDPPKGVLLHGPPGTGKTLVAKAVANESNSHFILINGPEIMSKYYGESEENLRKKFEEAEKNAPSIIFIDEVDAIASKREESKGEVERRVVAQLLALMDGLKSRGKVVVIAATNIVNSLDPALRRPGRFDREIEIGVPSKEGRLDILKIHTRNMPIDTSPKTLNIPLKESEIIEILKESVKDLTAKNLVHLLPKEAEIKEEVFLLLQEKIVQSLIKKASTKDPADEFITNCIGLIAKEIVSIARERMRTKGNVVSFDDGNILQQKLEQVVEDKHLRDIISQVVKETNLKELAAVTHGFVGADLAALAKEAAMIVLRRILPEMKLKEEEPIPKEILDQLRIGQGDFKESLRTVRPSAMREVLIEMPTIRWTDIGGLEGVKQELKEAVEWPLKHPEAFKRLGVKPPKGILIYGAPGTGKTLLAKAVAHESEANFILVKGPELLSKWVGESEKAVRKIFDKARQTAPTIIFFDEIDSLAPRRGMSSDSHVTERVVNQILTEMDGLVDLHDVVVLAATNRPDMLDTALLRPGRFDRIILTPVPDEETRRAIFSVHTKGMPLGKDVEVDRLAELTKDYVGADIEAVCREAAMLALREDIKCKEVKMLHFEAAMERVAPSSDEQMATAYEELKGKFRSARGKELEEARPTYFG